MDNRSQRLSGEIDDEIEGERSQGSHKVEVKNTFVSVIEDAPVMMGLERASTAPPLQGGHVDVGAANPVIDGQDSQVLPTSSALAPESLSRLNTADDFENFPDHQHGSRDDCQPWDREAATYLRATSSQDSPFHASGSSQTAATPETLFAEASSSSSGMHLFPSGWAMALPMLMPVLLPQEWTPQTFEERAHASQTMLQFQTVAPYRWPLGTFAAPVVDPFATDPEWEVLDEPPQPFQPQTVRRSRHRMTGATRVCWTVSGKKLRSNDRATVSPPFQVCEKHVGLGDAPPPLLLKIMITPVEVSTEKGGVSFQKARGNGMIRLKSEEPRAELGSYPISFMVSVGSGRPDEWQETRGYATCDFTDRVVCRFMRSENDEEIWSFADSVNKKTETFIVCLEAMQAGVSENMGDDIAMLVQ